MVCKWTRKQTAQVTTIDYPNVHRKSGWVTKSAFFWNRKHHAQVCVVDPSTNVHPNTSMVQALETMIGQTHFLQGVLGQSNTNQVWVKTHFHYEPNRRQWFIIPQIGTLQTWHDPPSSFVMLGRKERRPVNCRSCCVCVASVASVNGL